MEEIQDQQNIFSNPILLIYKHVYLPRNSESLKFIVLKSYILEPKILAQCGS